MTKEEYNEYQRKYQNKKRAENREAYNEYMREYRKYTNSSSYIKDVKQKSYSKGVEDTLKLVKQQYPQIDITKIQDKLY